MSEQTKSDDKSSQIPSGIAIVALLLGLFAVQDTIFKPTRPPMVNTERAFSEDVRSRLWQDPFRAVEEYRKKQYAEEAGTTSKNNILITTTAPADKHAYEYAREARQVCYDPAREKNREVTYSDSKVIKNSIEELNCQIGIETNSHTQDLHALAVMVPGGPYAEDKEWRLRSRYAVIAALTELGYTPKDPEHIDFVDFDRTCKAALRELHADKLNRADSEKEDKQKSDLKGKTHFCHMGASMPYEWFQNDNNETILLLWLDSSEFASNDNTTPLKILGFLKNKIGDQNNSKLRFSIIGPFGSSALKRMYFEVLELGKKNEYAHKRYKELNDTYIYTPAATVNQEHLNRYYDASVKKLDSIKSGKSHSNKDWLDKRIIRTISTQDKLADLLLCELTLRGVTPYYVEDDDTLSDKCWKTIPGEFKLKKGGSPHHIVLIGETDTYYSQKLTDSFLEAINKFNGKNLKAPSNKKPEWIHTYVYLRGLDGLTSEHFSNQKEEKNKKKESQTNKLNDTETREQMERPVGPSQLDYLLNLAEQIKQLDKQNAHEGGIKARQIYATPYPTEPGLEFRVIFR